jgi:hypothetical protein
MVISAGDQRWEAAMGGSDEKMGLPISRAKPEQCEPKQCKPVRLSASHLNVD